MLGVWIGRMVVVIMIVVVVMAVTMCVVVIKMVALVQQTAHTGAEGVAQRTILDIRAGRVGPLAFNMMVM